MFLDPRRLYCLRHPVRQVVLIVAACTRTRGGFIWARVYAFTKGPKLIGFFVIPVKVLRVVCCLLNQLLSKRDQAKQGGSKGHRRFLKATFQACGKLINVCLKLSVS